MPFGTATLAQMEALWAEAKAAEAALPCPLRPPLAALDALHLPVGAPAAAFWQRVGPLLGWAVHVDGPRVRCEAPGVAILFVPGTVGTPAELALRLQGNVTELAKAVQEAGGILHSLERGHCVFSDPGRSVVVRSRTFS